MSSPFPIVDVEEIGLHRKSSEINRDALEKVAEQLKDSFCKLGVCYFTNHGLANENRFLKSSEKFFKQPLEAKTQHPRGTRRDFGYTTIGEECPNLKRPGDFRECFNYQPSDDPNNWTDNDFPSACKKLFNECEIFGYRVLDALSLALGQDQSFLRDGHMKIGTPDNPTTLRALYYPPIATDDLKPDQIRLGEHSDFGTISFLFQDEVGGLEIEVKDKGFIHATPVPGTILVIAANLLQRWTADNVPAVVHKIMIPKDEEKKRTTRQSAVFFIIPDLDCLVKPMNDSSRYEPITCMEYLQPKMKAASGVTY